MARGTADTSLVKQGYSKVAYTPDTLEDFKNYANVPLYLIVNQGGIDIIKTEHLINYVIENGDLDRFDTIIMGIRAYNVNDELSSKNELLLDYAKRGGNLLIQYNTTRNLLTNKLTPFYLNLSRDRVTEEDSPVKILTPLHRALNFPHKITSEDFENWVQERGLYFPNKWDKNFIPMLSMNDKNENEKLGSLLIGNYGKGKIIYTGLSFFRQIPSGVTGAYRLLINLISLE